MAKSPAFQFYPADWLGSADIMTMTPAEEGAFIRLLSIAWLQDDCGLPDDDLALARLSRLGQHWFAGPDGTAMAQPLQGYGSGMALRKKFVARDGRLYNERLLMERTKQAERRSEKSEAGKKGAARRWKQTCYVKAIAQPKQSHGTATVLPMANDSSSSSSSSSNKPPYIPPVNGTLLNAEELDPKPELDRIFEAIRAGHPKGRKQRPTEERVQFDKKCKTIAAARTMLAHHQAERELWDDPQFVPHLFRWIRNFDPKAELPVMERRAPKQIRSRTDETLAAWVAAAPEAE